jgi:hypothetical protein
LVVHSGAVLAGTVTDQLLQSVAGRYPKVVQFIRGIENQQFSIRGSLNLHAEGRAPLAVPHPQGVLA